MQHCNDAFLALVRDDVELDPASLDIEDCIGGISLPEDLLLWLKDCLGSARSDRCVEGTSIRAAQSRPACLVLFGDLLFPLDRVPGIGFLLR